MRAADRAVGTACILLALLGCIAAIFFATVLASMFGVFRPSPIAISMSPGGMLTEQSSSPPFFLYLIALIPSLILILMGWAVLQGKKLGFQAMVVGGLIFALAGQSGNVFGVALAAYGVIRLANLFPDAPSVPPISNTVCDS